ncbi:MAG: peptidase domain-containing ABC transporter [Gemmataceae bacterium]
MSQTDYRPEEQTISFDPEVFRRRCVEVLEYLAKSCDMEIDRLVARNALVQAERDIPGPWRATWYARLTQAGSDLGLLITTVDASLSSAKKSASRAPLVTFAPYDDEDDTGLWVLLETGKTGVVSDQEESAIKWGEKKKIRQVLRGNSEEWSWISAQPMRPCQPLHEQPAEEHHHGPSPLTRLLTLFKQDRNDLWVVALFAVGVGLFSLATPIAVEAIVSTVQGGTRILLQPVIILSIVLFVFLGLAALLRVFQAIVVEFLQQRIFVRVSIDLANRLPQVRHDALDKHHGPELVNRFFDVLTVQKASAVLLIDGLSVVLQTAVGLVVLAFFNPYLLGFDLVLIGAIAFIIFVLGRGAVRTSIKESKAKYYVAGWLEEMVRHPLAFKMGGGRSYALHRANQLANNYVKSRRAHFKILFRQILFALILQVVASAALFGLGGWLVITNQLTLGQLVAAELILTMIVGSMLKLGKSLESYYDLMAGMDKLGSLIDLPLENSAGESLPLRTTPASLRICNLEYTAENSGRKLFDGLNLTAAPGESVAVLGPHGSGKSILVDLLYGLRQPHGGRIEIDGLDIRHVRLESLRSQVSTVKGVEIFEGSIADNITLGRPISLFDVRNALEAVGLLEELMDLPKGLETPLSTGGSPLSVGQLRRLMLARAMAGQPRLLLIDAAFDDLRSEVRETVLRAFQGPGTPWTLVIMTHKPAIAEMCDQQIYLEQSHL